MPPFYKTCGTVFKRQTLDNGSGRIFVPSSFGGGEDNRSNDSCSEVDVNDCPTGYKLLHTSSYPTKSYVNDTVTLTDDDLKNNLCWEGGHYKTGLSDQAPWGFHGLNHTYASNSKDNGLDADNFGRPCFKDATGWKRTDPVTGNKTIQDNEENHKNACCGFKESVRSDIDSNNSQYCDPNYCFTEYDEYDSISRSCASQLSKICESWGIKNDIIGFEDSRCSTPLSQIAKKYNKKVGDLTDEHLREKDEITAALSKNDYSRIGKKLCDKKTFLNKGSSDSEKNKKSEKCILWCKDNPDDCKDVIQDVCKTIYDRSKDFPDNFPDDLKKYEDICACNWPDEFYKNIIDYYKTTFNASNAQLSNDRKCLFRPCRSSNIIYPGDSLEECESTTFVSCIQNLNIDFRGSNIEGTVNVDGSQSQNCGSLADSGAGVASDDKESTSDNTNSQDNEEDNTLLIMGGGGFIVLLIILIVVFALK